MPTDQPETGGRVKATEKLKSERVPVGDGGGSGSTVDEGAGVDGGEDAAVGDLQSKMKTTDVDDEDVGGDLQSTLMKKRKVNSVVEDGTRAEEKWRLKEPPH